MVRLGCGRMRLLFRQTLVLLVFVSVAHLQVVPRLAQSCFWFGNIFRVITLAFGPLTIGCLPLCRVCAHVLASSHPNERFFCSDCRGPPKQRRGPRSDFLPELPDQRRAPSVPLTHKSGGKYKAVSDPPTESPPPSSSSNTDCPSSQVSGSVIVEILIAAGADLNVSIDKVR